MRIVKEIVDQNLKMYSLSIMIDLTNHQIKIKSRNNSDKSSKNSTKTKSMIKTMTRKMRNTKF